MQPGDLIRVRCPNSSGHQVAEFIGRGRDGKMRVRRWLANQRCWLDPERIDRLVVVGFADPDKLPAGLRESIARGYAIDGTPLKKRLRGRPQPKPAPVRRALPERTCLRPDCGARFQPVDAGHLYCDYTCLTKDRWRRHRANAAVEARKSQESNHEEGASMTLREAFKVMEWINTYGRGTQRLVRHVLEAKPIEHDESVAHLAAVEALLMELTPRLEQPTDAQDACRALRRLAEHYAAIGQLDASNRAAGNAGRLAGMVGGKRAAQRAANIHLSEDSASAPAPVDSLTGRT